METDSFNDAVVVFNSIENGDSNFHASRWYLALSHLKLNDSAKCKLVLRQIPKESPYFNQAEDLLRKMK
jgi:hypothetical protein